MIRSILKKLISLFICSASRDYSEISRADARKIQMLSDGTWKSLEVTKSQSKISNAQVKKIEKGKLTKEFKALQESFKAIDKNFIGSRSVLEIGCSTGYNSAVIDTLDVDYKYVGCDFSNEFIKSAKILFPTKDFDVQNAINLNYSSESFDVVVSGCCILHIEPFEEAIREAFRVARSYVIFHRTPIIHSGKHRFFQKSAYGFPSLEIHFNKASLYDLISSYGGKITREISVHQSRSEASPDIINIVCKKVTN